LERQPTNLLARARRSHCFFEMPCGYSILRVFSSLVIAKSVAESVRRSSSILAMAFVRTRLEKNPRGSAKLKWITAALPDGDDLICNISSAHTIRFVRRYFLVLGCFHLVQLLYSGEFNSRCSRKLTGAIHGSLGMGGCPSS
jgi:hypothetical protein